MTNADAFETFCIVAGVPLGLYWMVLALRSDKFWDWLFGVDESYVNHGYEQPRYVEAFKPRPIPSWPSIAYVAPAPRERKSFGTHTNPLSLEYPLNSCDGEFEKMDARTWQCLKCHLLNFVEITPEEPKA